MGGRKLDGRRVSGLPAQKINYSLMSAVMVFACS